jgi:hypothetical protein
MEGDLGKGDIFSAFTSLEYSYQAGIPFLTVSKKHEEMLPWKATGQDLFLSNISDSSAKTHSEILKVPVFG